MSTVRSNNFASSSQIGHFVICSCPAIVSTVCKEVLAMKLRLWLVAGIAVAGAVVCLMATELEVRLRYELSTGAKAVCYG